MKAKVKRLYLLKNPDGTYEQNFNQGGSSPKTLDNGWENGHVERERRIARNSFKP